MAAETGLDTPTQAELIDRTSGDYNSKLSAEDAYVRFSPGWIWSRVLSGAARLLHDSVAYVMRQVLPTTADEAWLPSHGEIRNVPRLVATFTTGDLDFTGVNGSVIPIGTAVQRVEDGVAATVTVGDTIAGGTATVTVQADEAGEDANTVAGVAWELVSPITGVDSEGEVNSATPLTGGADIEDLEDWRERIIDAWTQPGGPGAEGDYEKWAKLVEGVDKVFVTPNEFGGGTVGVRFTVKPTGTPPDSTTIIPSGADVTAVEASIALFAPITADVTVTLVEANDIVFTITPTPDTDAIQTAIETELDAMFIRLAESGGTIFRSQYRAAISAAAGETSHEVTVPAGDITNTTDQVAVRDTVTWP